MKTPTVLLHCSDTRLGGAASERDADVLRSFERTCDIAVAESVAVMIVCGRFFVGGAPAPAMLAAIEPILTRLRDASVALWTTSEQDQRGWLEYLASRELCNVLTNRGDDVEPPVAEPLPGLRLIGLGRPSGRQSLLARTSRLRQKTSVATIALLSATAGDGVDAISGADLSTLANKVKYLALGGSDEPQSYGEARDPGPLTNRHFASRDPMCLVVKVGKEVEIGERAIEDRPVLGIEVDAESTAASVEKSLRQLSRKRAGRPLLRIDCRGRRGDELQIGTLIALARDVVDPVDVRVFDHDLARSDASRRSLEHQVIADLTRDKDKAFGVLASSVLDALMTSDSGAAMATEQIVSYVQARRGIVS